MSRKANTFTDLLSEPTDPTPKPKTRAEPEAQNASSSEQPAARRGRPRRAAEVQVTTVRLDADDHREVRMLALRKGMSMTDLVTDALRQYCQGHGVKLK
jgi:uncharacterized protein (DUF4415 family)